MSLPEGSRAVIEPAKLRAYLLSSTHPVGRFKAVFFHALGYSADDWQTLEADLRELARTHEAVAGQVSPYGTQVRDACYAHRTETAAPPGSWPSGSYETTKTLRDS